MKRAAVVGTFDGVHIGHLYLLSTLRRICAERSLQPLVVTFNRHPLSLIAPERVPAELTHTRLRRQLLEAEGFEVEVLEFDDALRGLTAVEFLEMLHRRFGVELFLLGFNNRIGSDRLGTAALAGLTIGGVEVVAAAENPEQGVSSSAIRMALTEGDVAEANRMLGRPYAIEGVVIGGKRLGRTIGFPTANIEPAPQTALPAVGVYAGLMLGHKAVVNIGRRPTVEGRTDAPLSIEVHLLDFSGDLYGQHVKLEFLSRLRGEQKFAGLDELKKAIENDVQNARNL